MFLRVIIKSSLLHLVYKKLRIFFFLFLHILLIRILGAVIFFRCSPDLKEDYPPIKKKTERQNLTTKKEKKTQKTKYVKQKKV